MADRRAPLNRSNLSSGSANSARRSMRMDDIPAAGQPRPCIPAASASISNLQNYGNHRGDVGLQSRPEAQSTSPGPSAISTISTSSSTPLSLEPERLYKLYLESRQENEELRSKNTALRNTIATMVVKESAAKGSKKRGPHKIDDDEDIGITDKAFFTKLEKCGRWCLVFRACYFERKHFVDVHLKSEFDIEDQIRFLDDDHEDMGITEDLRDALPANAHELFHVAAENPKPNDPIAVFIKAASSGRSNFVKLLKGHADKIFNVPELAPTFPTENRLDVERIRYLIGYTKDPINSHVTYSRFFPAMCLNEDNSQDGFACRGEILYKIARGILFGAGAIFNIEHAAARSVSQFLRSDKPASTTCALISLCCIVARFLLSTDKQFDSTGKGKLVMYKDDYNYILQFLINSGALNPAWLERTKADWDLNVFRKQHTNNSSEKDGDVAAPDPIDRATEIARRLQGMNIVDPNDLPGPDPEPNSPTDYDDIYASDVDEPPAHVSHAAAPIPPTVPLAASDRSVPVRTQLEPADTTSSTRIEIAPAPAPPNRPRPRPIPPVPAFDLVPAAIAEDIPHGRTLRRSNRAASTVQAANIPPVIDPIAIANAPTDAPVAKKAPIRKGKPRK